MFKSGYIGIIGSPNAGKSTILNEILDAKVVITSDKVGTTRNVIKGIYTDEKMQVVFADTPGINNPQNKLQVMMQHYAEATIFNVNIVLYVLDAKVGFRDKEKEIVSKISQNKDVVKIACINKIDLIEQEQALILINQLQDLEIFSEVVALSAKEHMDGQAFMNMIYNYLPAGDLIYDQDQVVDFSENFYISEIIREKVLDNTFDEVPHGVYVKVQDKIVDKNKVYIEAIIFVERESQKGIVIGNKASMIKNIGQSGRKDLETYYQKKVFLDLIVRVDKKWTNKDMLFFEDLNEE